MVIQGFDSKRSRSDEAIELWLWAFRNFDDYKIAKGGMALANAPVWLGQQGTVPVGPREDVVLTLPRSARHQLKATAVFDGPLAAPVAAGQVVGKLRLEAPGVIPRLSNHDRWAQSREPMEVMCQGCSMSLFQA